MAVAFGVTIVVFSPASRGSRSLLERTHDFVTLLGMESRIMSYNQENLKVRSLDGRVSLVRSFPSKIEVCAKHNAYPHVHRTPFAHPLHIHRTSKTRLANYVLTESQA